MTLDELTEILRNRLGLPPNEIPRLKTLVGVAIQGLVERAGAHIDKRNYVFTDPTATTVDLDVSGVGDLEPLIISDGILLEGLRYGQITHPSSPYPLVPKQPAEGALPSNYSAMGFLRYWLVGTKIFTSSSDNNVTPLTGALALAVPFANGLNNLSVQLEDELIEMLVLQERGAPRQQAVAQ